MVKLLAGIVKASKRTKIAEMKLAAHALLRGLVVLL